MAQHSMGIGKGGKATHGRIHQLQCLHGLDAFDELDALHGLDEPLNFVGVYGSLSEVILACFYGKIKKWPWAIK